MEQKPKDSEIRVLKGLDAVRARPAMYLGQLENALLPNVLLREALCCARDEALQGRCQSVSIRLDSGGRATVGDDGPGLSLDMTPSGKRNAELHLTELYACASAKSSEAVAKSTCVLSLAVLNAMCSELTMRIFADGAEWMQQYREGKPVSELAIVEASTQRGTEFSFKLDANLLPQREFQWDEFTSWLKENVKALAVNVHDARTNQTFHLDAQ